MPEPIFTPSAIGAGLSLVPPVIDIARKLRENGEDPSFSEIIEAVKTATRDQLVSIRDSLDKLRSALSGLDLDKSFKDLLSDHDSWFRIWNWPTYGRIDAARRQADDARRAIRDGMSDLVRLMMCKERQEGLAALGLDDRGKVLRQKLLELDQDDISVNQILRELAEIVDDLLAEAEAI